ncbi:toprim domain-containing protein, partial [Massilia pseudoviolaceinigra]|uniref:toprim domain-containing protein n=1 Tax=Massilia pseudoviolaceinigra TaxID=3057165 RepID=UPI0027963E92
MTNIEAEFGAAMAVYDLAPAEIIADGKRRRFDAADDKKGKKSAWYILYGDGVPAGAFGNWKTDLSEKWCGKSDQKMTPIENAEYRARVDKARQEAEHTRLQLEADAAAVCVRVLAGAQEATDDNPYCVRKGIKPYGLKEFKDKRTLIVPIRDAAGAVTSLQFIYEDGTKRLKSHGKVKGCYYSFGGKPTDTLLVCEGFATGASLFAVTGYPVAVAFNAGNLEPVARALRGKLPGVRIVVCADDDRFNEQ